MTPVRNSEIFVSILFSVDCAFSEEYWLKCLRSRCQYKLHRPLAYSTV